MKTATQTKTLLAPDAFVPQRDTLLDENAMRERLSKNICKHGAADLKSCEIKRVKYRVGANLRVLYEVSCGELSLLVAARTFENNRGAEVCEESLKNAVAISSARPVFYDAELETVFWTFPNDRKLNNLKILQSVPGNLAEVSGQMWTTSRIVAYAPEKGATAECLNANGGTIAYAKVYADDAGRNVYRTYDALGKITNGENNLRLPRALCYSEVHRTLILEAVEGVRIADLDSGSLGEGYRKLGAAISNLHNIPPPEFISEFTRLKPSRIQTALEIVKTACPDISIQAEKLAEKLFNSFQFADEPTVCLHGDVHPKNGIINAGRLTLIDLDQASSGAAACDISSFIASLFYKQCAGEISTEKRKEYTNAFLEGYEKNRRMPEEKSLRWHTATAIFNERVLRSINRVRREGLENLRELLAAGETIFDGGIL
jgi:aminoglycoside phosphotransferase (APT) family kinase protein